MVFDDSEEPERKAAKVKAVNKKSVGVELGKIKNCLFD